MKKTKLDYKWVIVALCFVMVFTTLGFCSSTKSLFVKPITELLLVDRTVYSFVDSLRFISTAVVNIFFGFLVAKFGVKKLITAGFSSPYSLNASFLLCGTYDFLLSWWNPFRRGTFLYHHHNGRIRREQVG